MKNIDEILNTSNLYDKKSIMEIFYYINTRIDRNLILSNEEKTFVNNFLINIKQNVDLDLSTKNKLLKRIGELYLMSLNIEYYKEIKQKSFNDYNEEDILYYLNMYLINAPQFITKDLISKILTQYLDEKGNVNNLLELLNKYKNNIGEFNYEIYYWYISNMSYNFYCYKILDELDNEKINKEEIFNYFDMLLKINAKENSKKILILKNIKIKIYKNYELNKLNKNDLDLLLSKLNLLNKKMNLKYDKEKEIENLFKSGNIVLNRIQPYFENVDTSIEKLKVALNDKIFIVSKTIYNKELAFSIRKDKDIYILKVYLIDIPIFLHKNKEIEKYAYNNGENMFVKYGNKNLLIPMLPLFLVRKNLSFNPYYYKSAIEFEFIINNQGEILSRNISRKNVRITDALLVNNILDLLNTNEDSLVKYCMFNYYNLCQNLSVNHLNTNKLDNEKLLIETPIKLIDEYVSNESEFAIFNTNRYYTKDNTGKICSALPLSKYVCNINLAFFLEQKGIYKFDDKDLYFVEDNVDEIINHLNQRHDIKNYAYKYPEFVKKYVR